MSEEGATEEGAVEVPEGQDDSLLGGGETQGQETQAGEPAGDETLLGQGQEEGQAVPEGAPEEYSDFTYPEGVNLDEAAMAEAIPVFKELNLSQDQAQKLVDFDAARIQQADQQWAETNAQWVNDIKTDTEMGGGKFPETLQFAKTAMDKLGSDGLKQILNESGMGNHPEMVRVFSKMGRLLSEDQVHTGQPSAVSKDPAYVLFPSMRT